MDFINRGPQHNAVPGGAPANSPLRRGGKGKLSKILGLATSGLLFSIAILSVAVLLGVVFSKDAQKEEDNVDSSRYQIVVISYEHERLIYYGKITNINKEYLTLGDVFYVTPSQLQDDSEGQAKNAKLILVKQGCELYGPVGDIIIRRDKVVTWQNMKSDGKVGKVIAEHKQKFPNGQQCVEATATDTPTPAAAEEDE